MRVIGFMAMLCLFQMTFAGGGLGHSDAQKKTSYYLIAKAAGGTGDAVNGVEGENIYGGAIDVGIKPAGWKNFSLELNALYEEGTGVPYGVKGKASVEEDLTFQGVGLNLAYTKHFRGFSLVGKSGIKHEREKAEEPGHAAKTIKETGLALAGGIEFPLPGRMELAIELETVSFDTPKGMDLLVGIKVPLGR